MGRLSTLIALCLPHLPSRRIRRNLAALPRPAQMLDRLEILCQLLLALDRDHRHYQLGIMINDP